MLTQIRVLPHNGHSCALKFSQANVSNITVHECVRVCVCVCVCVCAWGGEGGGGGGSGRVFELYMFCCGGRLQTDSVQCHVFPRRHISAYCRFSVSGSRGFA